MSDRLSAQSWASYTEPRPSFTLPDNTDTIRPPPTRNDTLFVPPTGPRPLPLRPTNPDYGMPIPEPIPSPRLEYMDISPAIDVVENGLPVRKPRRFIGGFFKRFVRGRGNTNALPLDIPPSLIPGGGQHLSGQRSSGQRSSGQRLSGQRLSHPSVHVSPPSETPFPAQRQSIDPTTIPLPSSPAPETTLSPRSHPASIAANVIPSDDYRRMSKGVSNSSSRSADPSFTTELDPLRTFFAKLNALPWIAGTRVTEDYRPGLNRGAWTSKRVRVEKGSSESKTAVVLKPIKKPLKSWYTSLNPKNPPRQVPKPEAPSTRTDSQIVDLLSSGTISSATTSLLMSPQRHHRHHSNRHNHSPTAVQYPHGYKPASIDHTRRSRPGAHSASTSSPKSKSPSLPRRSHHTRTPPMMPNPATPVYVLHTPPMGTPQGATDSYPMQILSPVYLQMAMLPYPPPPNQIYGNHSPPGLAGRGAFGQSSNNVPNNVPGGFHGSAV